MEKSFVVLLLEVFSVQQVIVVGSM